MSTPGEHVGVDALLAERKELLDRYDAVKMKGGYDAVESQHGNAAEDYFRAFLAEFLPKKYGVTKGHVITPGLGYAGDLEGWDVIIYDALESPILFGRPSLIDPKATRAIPIEFVKAVLEVKATFTIKHAKKVVDKLLKLQHFREPASKEPWDRALPKDFFTAAVFFETKVEDAKEFSKAIDALSPLWESTPGMPTAGALILRGQTHPTKSAVIGTQVGRDVPPDDESVLEHGHGFKSQNKIISKDSWEYITSFGFSENTFWSFLIVLYQVRKIRALLFHGLCRLGKIDWASESHQELDRCLSRTITASKNFND